MEIILQLKNQLDNLSIIEKSLNEQNEKINEIDGIVNGIDSKSNELFSQCNEILKKKNKEEEVLKKVEKEIRYYEAFDRLSLVINNPKTINFYSNQFKECYIEINECIEYFYNKKNDVECYTYLLKYQQLKSKILNYLSIFIKKQIDDLHQECSTIPVLPLNQFTKSVLYKSQITTEFKELIKILEIRKGILESSYLDECIKHYLNIRKNLLMPYISKLLITLQQINPFICDVTREAGIYLFIIFYKEGKLFRTLFNQDCQALKIMFSSLFDIYSSFISTLCYKCHDIGILCNAITYLKDEQILYRLPHSKLIQLPEYSIFNFCVNELVTNISERLVYLSLNLINNLIASFHPSKNDLNYPAIFSNSNVQDLPFKLVLYPPTTNTLTLLSKLHFSLSNELFSQIANTAINACVDSILHAIPQIPSNNELDGKLFALRNLCILRDQIIPFTEVDTSLRKVETKVQELCGEICNYFLKTFCPSGLQVLRDFVFDDKSQNEIKVIQSQIIEELVHNSINSKEDLNILHVYLHQVHLKELLEILKARIVYFAHKLTILFRDQDFEKRFLEAAKPILNY
ncbi:hypothetical protein ENUP19_0164G0003 [Entamoeba nuttalli]